MALIDLWTTQVADKLGGTSNLNVDEATAAGYKGHNSPTGRPSENVLIKNKSTTDATGTAYFKGLEKPTTTVPGSMLAKSPFNDENIGKADFAGFSSVYGNFPTVDDKAVFSSENFTPHKTGDLGNGTFVDGFSRTATGRLYNEAAALAPYAAEPAEDPDPGEDDTEKKEIDKKIAVDLGAGDAAPSQPGFQNWKASRGGQGTVDDYMAEFGLTSDQVSEVPQS